MYSERARGRGRLALYVLTSFLLFSCGGDEKAGDNGAPTLGASNAQSSSLVLVIDFERRHFELQTSGVPLWTLPFFNADSSEVNHWIGAFGTGDQAVPLSENILLRSKNLLKDSVIAIVADASGFDAHLLQRQIPARFVLRWEDAALVVESAVSAEGGGLSEAWQSARSTARRLFGEAQMNLVVDSLGALTLQRVAVPPLATRVRPPRKR